MWPKRRKIRAYEDIPLKQTPDGQAQTLVERLFETESTTVNGVRAFKCSLCEGTLHDRVTNPINATTKRYMHLQAKHSITNRVSAYDPLGHYPNPSAEDLARKRLAEAKFIEFVRSGETKSGSAWMDMCDILSRGEGTSADQIVGEYAYLYQEQRQALVTHLQINCRGIVVSVSYRLLGDHGVVGVYGHWLTPTFEVKESILNFKIFEGKSTPKVLAKCVSLVLEELGLESRLVGLVASEKPENEEMAALLHGMLRQKGNVHYTGEAYPSLSWKYVEPFTKLPHIGEDVLATQITLAPVREALTWAVEGIEPHALSRRYKWTGVLMFLRALYGPPLKRHRKAESVSTGANTIAAPLW